MTAVPQVGSKLARSACGTKRSVRAAPCASAGVARRGEAASAAAPAADFRNLRRFMVFPHPASVRHPTLEHDAEKWVPVFGKHHAPTIGRRRHNATVKKSERGRRFGRFRPMESLLKFLPARRQPVIVRYGASAVLVLVVFAFRLGAGPAAGEYSFIFFIPPILAAAVLFDRGSGFVATA